MSGWIYLALGLLVSGVDFMVGLYMLRRGDDRPGLYSGGMPLAAEATARVGRLIMFISPLFLIVFGLLAFGLIPVEGIEPISFN